MVNIDTLNITKDVQLVQILRVLFEEDKIYAWQLRKSSFEKRKKKVRDKLKVEWDSNYAD